MYEVKYIYFTYTRLKNGEFHEVKVPYVASIMQGAIAWWPAH